MAASRKKSFSDDTNPAARFVTGTESTVTDPPEEEIKIAPKTKYTKKEPAPRWSKDPTKEPEKRTKRVQIVLPPSLHDAARAEAEKQGISLNEMIIRGLEAQVKKGAK